MSRFSERRKRNDITYLVVLIFLVFSILQIVWSDTNPLIYQPAFSQQFWCSFDGILPELEVTEGIAKTRFLQKSSQENLVLYGLQEIQ